VLARGEGLGVLARAGAGCSPADRGRRPPPAGRRPARAPHCGARASRRGRRRRLDWGASDEGRRRLPGAPAGEREVL